MADRLDELRIDRSENEPESPWPRRLLLLEPGDRPGRVAAWWFLGGDPAVEVECRHRRRSARRRRARASVLDASGYVVARRQATVASKITGRLVEVAIEEGMSVKDGQVLARLDDANARQRARAGRGAARRG